MLVIGCDPGLTGALSLIGSGRGLLECADMPTCPNGTASGKMLRWVDESALQQLLADWSTRHGFAGESVHAAIERPIPMPTLPAQTIASQFDTFGVLRAQLARHAEVVYPNPRDWKRLFGLGGKDEKDRARQVAVTLYPDAPVQRVKDHNRAESVLIGHWRLRELA